MSSAVSTGTTYALAASQQPSQVQPQQQSFVGVGVPQMPTNAASVAYFDESGQVFFFTLTPAFFTNLICILVSVCPVFACLGLHLQFLQFLALLSEFRRTLAFLNFEWFCFNFVF